MAQGLSWGFHQTVSRGYRVTWAGEVHSKFTPLVAGGLGSSPHGSPPYRLPECLHTIAADFLQDIWTKRYRVSMWEKPKREATVFLNLTSGVTDRPFCHRHWVTQSNAGPVWEGKRRYENQRGWRFLPPSLEAAKHMWLLWNRQKPKL